MLASIGSLVGLAAVALGAVLLLTRRGFSGSEALSCGLAATLAAYSFILQLGFILGLPILCIVLEIALVGAALATIVRFWSTVSELAIETRRLLSSHPWVLGALFVVAVYLLAQALILPPSNWDSYVYNLSRVLLMDRSRSLFLNEFTSIHQAVFPAGSDILAWIFLRSGVDYFVGLFSWLSWAAIVSGSWALAMRVAPRAAATTALVVGGLPELVYQATSTKSDIVAAGAGIAALQIAFRLYQRVAVRDLLLGSLLLAFGTGAKSTFPALLLPMLLIWAPLIAWRHWQRRPRTELHFRLAYLIVPPVLLVLCGLPLLVHNHQRWGGMLGPPKFTTPYRNQDGLIGALANLSRYALQSVDFLPPMDTLAKITTGYRASDVLRRAHEIMITPLLGNAGLVQPPYRSPFHVYWRAHEDHSWFGPAWALLLVPAVIRSASRRRDDRVMAAAWTMLACIWILSSTIAWMSWNARFFSLAAVCASPLVASWLAQGTMRRQRLAAALGLTTLSFASLFNVAKPAIALDERSGAFTLRGNAWQASRLGTDRHYPLDPRTREALALLAAIPKAAKVGVACQGACGVYPFLRALRDRELVVGSVGPYSSSPRGVDYLLFFGDHCRVNAPPAALVWAVGDTCLLRTGDLPRRFR